MVRTLRMRIEPLVPEHAGALFDDLRDPALYAFIPDEPPDSLAALVTRFERLCAGPSPRREESWLNWVMLDLVDDRPVGTLQATIGPADLASIAYLVVARRWGEGYGREGVTWLIDHLTTRRVSLLEARIDTRNAASIRLVEALGFRCERTISAADHFKGSASDEHVYQRKVSAETR